ncbi:MAG TPA: hypothetical protein VLA64_04115, partial [Azonexus sp.]|nr:hypothetical protein [Azonexus sp.]
MLQRTNCILLARMNMSKDFSTDRRQSSMEAYQQQEYRLSLLPNGVKWFILHRTNPASSADNAAFACHSRARRSQVLPHLTEPFRLTSPGAFHDASASFLVDPNFPRLRHFFQSHFRSPV